MRKLLLATIVAAPATASAGGFLLPNENARDLALAQATVAAQDDGPAAIFLNPAALAGPKGFAISASGELLINRTDWSDPNLGSASLTPQINTPPAIAASYGDKLSNGMAWGAGVGVDVPCGGSIIWPAGWPGQEFAQSIKQQGFRVTAGAAFRPIPELAVGVTYLRYQFVEDLHQSINYLDHYGDAALGLSGGGNGFGAAVEYRVPSVPLSLGVNYHHSADVALTGDVHFTSVPPQFSAMIHDQSVSETLRVPNVLAIGGAYDVRPDLKLMATYTFERWSIYTDDTFVGSDGFTVKVARNYNNAHVIRFGGEMKHPEFRKELTLRAGLLRSISSQPTETLSPSLTDASSWAVSIGAGYEVTDAVRVDLGYQHAFFDAVTASGMDTLPGTYNTGVDLISLGVHWRMK